MGHATYAPSWLRSRSPNSAFAVKIAQLVSLIHASNSFGGIMCLLAITFHISIRKIIVTLQKIATITFLDTSSLMSTFYGFLFRQRHTYGGRTREGKFFLLGALLPLCPQASWLRYKRGRETNCLSCDNYFVCFYMSSKVSSGSRSSYHFMISNYFEPCCVFPWVLSDGWGNTVFPR